MPIIEFVAPAGAGKTSIANALYNLEPKLKRPPNPFSSRNVFEVLFHPGEVLRSLLFLSRQGGIRFLFSKTGLIWFLLISSFCKIRRTDQHSYYLYDQLFLQALRRIARETQVPLPDLLTHGRGALPFPDVLVFIQAPPSTIRRRKEKRDGDCAPTTSKQLCNHDDIDYRMWRDLLHMRRAMRTLENHPSGPRIIILDGRPPPEENARRLINEFDELFEGKAATSGIGEIN